MSEALQGAKARIAHLVMPNETNHLGTLFGGVALGLMDHAAFVAASRLARRTAVTVSVDRIDFKVPVHAGDLVEVEARVVGVGRTSMTIEVELSAENLLTGERRQATTGRFVFVALGDDGNPTPVSRSEDGPPA